MLSRAIGYQRPCLGHDEVLSSNRNDLWRWREATRLGDRVSMKATACNHE